MGTIKLYSLDLDKSTSFPQIVFLFPKKEKKILHTADNVFLTQRGSNPWHLLFAVKLSSDLANQAD